MISTYKFINHNADSPDLHYLGKLKSGNELWINSIVSKVDFIITTGVIVPHYFAGFSGGRKSVLPGICGRKTIEANHAKMVHPNARAGNLKGNPVHQEMQETVEKVRKLFFIPMDNLSQAIDYIKNKHGKDFQACILPSGNTILPQLI